MGAALPAELAGKLEAVDAQLLTPVEESTLRPVGLAATTDEDDDSDRPPARIAPALWTIPARGLPLDAAVTWLAALDAKKQPPALRALAAASQLVLRMVARGDYAPAPQPGVLRWAPHWAVDTQWAMAAISDLLPGALCTARFAVPDDPV
ncbi:MAG: hypothetical protein FJ306_01845, partial [Planctomycetes bacterium]|nr:hypothetical protein [Planctomycetota bacterium]